MKKYIDKYIIILLILFIIWWFVPISSISKSESLFNYYYRISLHLIFIYALILIIKSIIKKENKKMIIPSLIYLIGIMDVFYIYGSLLLVVIIVLLIKNSVKKAKKI